MSIDKVGYLKSQESQGLCVFFNISGFLRYNNGEENFGEDSHNNVLETYSIHTSFI